MPKGKKSLRKRRRKEQAHQAKLLPTVTLALELLKLIVEIAVIFAALAK